MSSVARTRCSTCEWALLLALGLVPTLADAVELWPAVRLGGGYLDNPFFDDDTLRAQSPIAGPVGFAAPAFTARFEPGTHRLEAGVGGRFTFYGGDALAQARHARIHLGWRWPREGSMNAELTLAGRHDGVDRFPEDGRNGGRFEAALGWRPTERIRLRPQASASVRHYPERPLASGENQTDFVFDGGLGLTIGPLYQSTLLSLISVDVSATQTESNADTLERQGIQGGLGWTGLMSPWRLQAGAFGWLERFADRLDRGGQLTAGLGRELWSGVSLGIEAHGLVAGGETQAARYQQWGGLLVLDLTTDFTVETRAEWAPGVTPTGDGRWRFVIGAPRARRVDLVGDFNDWRVGAHALQRVDDTLWVVTATLPPGQHTFMFVIDGTFVTPPFGPTRDDGFGRQVGVIRVLKGRAGP